MKRIFILLIAISLCGSISASIPSMQNRTENWLKKSPASEGNGGGVQGGNRAGDETPKGEVGVGTPVGDGVCLTLLLAGAYMCFYLPRQKDKVKA